MALPRNLPHPPNPELIDGLRSIVGLVGIAAQQLAKAKQDLEVAQRGIEAIVDALETTKGRDS